MNKDINLSAIIVAKDEEKMIEGCLQSLDFVDEIVVIDTGSTDKTAKIAGKYGARVVTYTSGKSYSDWRNKGLSESKGTWILYIDADERIPNLLKKELLRTIASDDDHYSAYAIPRSNIIFGKAFRHGGWWPDYVKRLYLKKHLKKWTGNLHEEPVFEGKLGLLENHFDHIKHETIFEMVEKTNKWSLIEAQLMLEANHPPMNVRRFLTAMFREFWYRMIRHGGFLDGKAGIMMSMYQVFSRFVSYAKLWELQIKK